MYSYYIAVLGKGIFNFFKKKYRIFFNVDVKPKKGAKVEPKVETKEELSNFRSATLVLYPPAP